MAAIASSAPIPASSIYGNLPGRSSNHGIARITQSRRLSPLAIGAQNYVPSGKQSVGDSSDDEDLAPIKLSAEAQEILGENASRTGAPRMVLKNSAEKISAESRTAEEYAVNGPQSYPRETRSPGRSNGSPAPRVTRRNSGSRPPAQGILARDGSFLYKNHGKSSEILAQSPHDLITPAPRVRRVRVSGSRSHTRSPLSTSSGSNGKKTDSGPRPQGRLQAEESPDGANMDDQQQLPIGLATVMRSRRGEDNGAQSTMRVKRIGTGAFLTGPVRRGMIRRQSGEDVNHYEQSPENRHSPSNGSEQNSDLLRAVATENHLPQNSGESDRRAYSSAKRNPQQHLSFASSATAVASETSGFNQNNQPSPPQVPDPVSKSTPGSYSQKSLSGSKSSSAGVQPVFKVPPLPPLPSAHDQENEPPPTFKRSKQSASMLGEVHKIYVMGDEKAKSRDTPSTISPDRQPLAVRSQNTPHRAAPPPPKMSIIEAATSTAGSARKKKIQVSVNGRLYHKLDRLGSGGSSAVYRVMAPNFNILAMKRVNLANADPAAIAGYKGEIELLRKLGNVERVIRLFDYEINEEKSTLSVLMEMGESDFSTMLNRQLKTENARLDVSFTRYYWKEMLECVQAVHDYDIVHSDLKPANFLLVRGQLKLIDFGIANAIQDDTVNVHRENQIGTPNYMSPESLMCHSDPGPNGGKLLKLGKPSDVWSLGCILYQMTYGQPPFAHFQNQHKRIMSIVDPKVEIQYPTTGVGGVTVPFGLIKTLRRCLQRDQILRPKIPELLSDHDPFLNPVAISPDMLGRMISNVIRHCRKREDELRSETGFKGKTAIPTDEEIKAWPLAFYDKLREAQEQGTAW